MPKMLDASVLDRNFFVVPDRTPGRRLLTELATSKAHYCVIGDRLQVGGYGLLVRRGHLMEDVVDDTFDSARQRDEWQAVLATEPLLLMPLIAARLHHGAGVIDLPLLRDYAIGDAERTYIDKYMADYLYGRRTDTLRAMVIDASLELPTNLTQHVIAVNDLQVVIGIAPSGALPEAEEPRWVSPPARAQPPPAALAAAPISAPAVESAFEGTPPSAGAAPESAGAPPGTPPFVAYPALDITSPVRRGEEFSFDAGFSDTADPDAEEIKRIRIPDAAANDELLVVATAEGAQIVEPSHVVLKLDLAQRHTFKAIVDDDAQRVLLRATYFHRNRHVGLIAKLAPLEGAASNDERRELELQTASPGLAHIEGIEGVDLYLMVQRRREGWITWKALDGAKQTVFGPVEVRLGDTREFARKLAGLRKVYGDSGAGAFDELKVIGQQIAEHIPAALQERVLAPAIASGTPSVLLMTDEAFMPWELARLGPPHFEKPAFLGELTQIGRWWTGHSLSGPLSQCHIENISAVAATQYPGGLAMLRHAIAERRAMVRRFRAKPVDATLPMIDAWLATVPRPTGHLAHIALHGFSDVNANAQGLTLGDGKQLTPAHLVGEYFPGNVPRFEIVFLNACQVGTAGEALDRIGGFPGAALRGGASAFIAPLWEVQDSVALRVARQFYIRVFMKRQEIGTALRELRCSSRLASSISPWAYLYYGHPKLKLSRAP